MKTRTSKITRTRALFAGIVSLLALSVSALPAYAQSDIVQVDIDAQPLAKALIEYAEQTDIVVMAPAGLVEGKATDGVEGVDDPELALDRLLVSTGLEYRFVGDDTVAITPGVASADAGEAGNDRLAPSPMLMAQASMDQNRRATTGAVEATNEGGEETDLQIEEIIVTGTNIRGVENPTTPVLQFSRDVIDVSGAVTVEEFLRTVPQNFSSETPLGQNSANPFDSNNNLTQGTSVDLRGLGAGSTLILLNGRRMNASGLANFVDVSVIPLGAIERVDIQTDGASAVYGSDAVGGVVNFITRKDFEGFEIGGRYGSVTDGSKEEYGLNGAGGLSWDVGGVLFGAEHVDTRPLLSSERTFIDTDIANPSGSLGAETQKHSLFGSLNQNVTDKLTVYIDTLFTDREFENDQQGFGQITFRGAQESFFVNARADYELTDHIMAQLFVDHGREDFVRTDSRDDFGSESELKNRLTTVEGQLTGQAFDLPSGSVSFALGGSFREEEYEDVGSLSADRDVTAAYGELLVPLVGQNHDVTLIQELVLSVAGRYEDYSDFGDTFNPRVGLYWLVNDDFSFRASYSEAFRAPVLTNVFGPTGYLFFEFPSAAFTAIDPPAQDPRLPAGFVSVLTNTGANPALTPETAETLTIGGRYEPDFIPGLSFDVNYYDISYSDRVELVIPREIFQIEEFTVLAQIPPNLAEVQEIFDAINSNPAIDFSNFSDIIDPVAEDVQVLIAAGLQNLSRRDLRGIDVLADYEFEADIGQFAASFNASYIFDFESQLSEIADAVEQINTLYRPIDLNLRAALSWSNGGLSAFAAVNYTGSYRDNVDTSIANEIDAWTTVDLSIAFNTRDSFSADWKDDIVVRFGVQNLFDEGPPFVATPADGLNYDTANADPFGRMLNVSVSKQF